MAIAVLKVSVVSNLKDKQNIGSSLKRFFSKIFWTDDSYKNK